MSVNELKQQVSEEELSGISERISEIEMLIDKENNSLGKEQLQAKLKFLVDQHRMLSNLCNQLVR